MEVDEREESKSDQMLRENKRLFILVFQLNGNKNALLFGMHRHQIIHLNLLFVIQSENFQKLRTAFHKVRGSHCFHPTWKIHQRKILLCFCV